MTGIDRVINNYLLLEDVGIFTSKVDGKRELDLANQHVKNGELEKALEYAKQATQILRQKGDPKTTVKGNAKVLEIQALIHKENGSIKNASSAFKQAAMFYKQAGLESQYESLLMDHIELLQEIGQRKASKKSFETAASSYEAAALAYKDIGREIKSYELRAKAFVFRAASVRNPRDRKSFLMKAVNLIKESGIDEPIMQGHLAYYSAMVERLSEPNLAINSLDQAINYYKMADNENMIQTAIAMKSSLQKQLEDSN